MGVGTSRVSFLRQLVWVLKRTHRSTLQLSYCQTADAVAKQLWVLSQPMLLVHVRRPLLPACWGSMLCGTAALGIQQGRCRALRTAGLRLPLSALALQLGRLRLGCRCLDA